MTKFKGTGKKFYIVGKAVKVTDDGFLLIESSDGSRLKVKVTNPGAFIKENPKNQTWVGSFNRYGIRCLHTVQKTVVGLHIKKSRTARAKAWAEVHNRELEESGAKMKPKGSDTKMNAGPLHTEISHKRYDETLNPESKKVKKEKSIKEELSKKTSSDFANMKDWNAYQEAEIRKNIKEVRKIKTKFKE